MLLFDPSLAAEYYFNGAVKLTLLNFMTKLLLLALSHLHAICKQRAALHASEHSILGGRLVKVPILDIFRLIRPVREPAKIMLRSKSWIPGQAKIHQSRAPLLGDVGKLLLLRWLDCIFVQFHRRTLIHGCS
jgi:hypothetical protein